jgi:hypothetical protein
MGTSVDVTASLQYLPHGADAGCASVSPIRSTGCSHVCPSPIRNRHGALVRPWGGVMEIILITASCRTRPCTPLSPHALTLTYAELPLCVAGLNRTFILLMRVHRLEGRQRAYPSGGRRNGPWTSTFKRPCLSEYARSQACPAVAHANPFRE